jgi:transposase
MDTTDARHLPLAVLNERRRRAVKLRERGMTLREVAAQVELSVPTVMAAHRAYLAGGWAAVNVKPRGRKRGEGRQLTPEQEAEIRRLICDKTPDQLKMAFALWNRQAVSQLIEDRLGIKVPIRTIGEYLKRWGFTPQKPIKKAYEQRPAEVRKWLDEEYPQIAGRAKAEQAEIHWGDETGLRSDDVRGRGYAPKGQTPVVRVNNKREGLSIISTVTNQGKVRWKVFEGAMNADVLIDFFKRLIKDAKRKVFLILDNLKVHHARKVKDWLAKHEKEIEVFYLPSYSPELNPDECLNADLKDGVTRRAPARSKAQLKKAAISHLRKLQKSPRRVRKYFEHKPVRYAA